MRAFAYFFSEAAESLWRSRRAAVLSMLTIAAGLFVLGFFVMVNANLQRVVAQLDRRRGARRLPARRRPAASRSRRSAT